jgi:MFS transporter, PPP family, 3-phenylpropionic acid transporter
MPVPFLPLSFRLALFYFAFFAYAGAYVAYFPAYLAWRGLGAAEIAWVIALPPFVRVIAPTAWGALADRTGWQRGIVAFACAANAACFVLLPYAAGFGAIAWLIAGTAALASAALPLVEAIALAALADRPGRYGPVRLWGSVGFIAVVLGGGAWLDRASIESLPAALALCALACLAAAFYLPAGARHASTAPAPLVVGRPAQALLAAGFCMCAAHGALYVFFTLHLQREGYSGTAIGLFWTLGVVAEIVVFLYLPALFRRFSLSTILVASFACAVLRFLAIGWFAAVPAVLLPAQLLHAATFGSFHAASIAAVRRIFPPGAQGRGQTLFSSVCYGAGGAVGTLLAGWAWETAGPAFAFSLSSGIALTGLLLAYSLKRAGL